MVVWYLVFNIMVTVKKSLLTKFLRL